ASGNTRDCVQIVNGGATALGPWALTQGNSGSGLWWLANPFRVFKWTATHDFDGDGKSDIVWRQDTGTAALWLMNGATLAQGAGVGNVPTAWTIAGAADYDGDAKDDILWRNTTTGDIAIWFMNGTQLSSAAVVGNVPVAWSIAATGDFDGDG